MFYVDCGLTYDGSAVTTISGLEHLEGQSVRVLGDGKDRGAFTVTGGAITLPEPASVAHAGLAYSAVLQSMPVGRVGARSSIKRAFVRLLGTVGGKIGESVARAKALLFATGVSGPVAYTGVKRDEGGFGASERETSWLFVHDAPFACTLLGVLPTLVETSDEQ